MWLTINPIIYCAVRCKTFVRCGERFGTYGAIWFYVVLATKLWPLSGLGGCKMIL